MSHARAIVDLSPYEYAVDRLDTHAAAPAVIKRLLGLLVDPAVSWRQIEECLAVDGGLAARVLRIASSPAFAARPVRDLRVALQSLGCEEVRRIAVAAYFAGTSSAFGRALWVYSLRIAFTTDALARAGSRDGGPDAFLSGLLHDVGTMALEQVMRPGYTTLFAPGDDHQLRIERDTYGFDHADLGAMVAARWNLFPELGLIAQLHHEPEACDAIGMAPATRAMIERVALARCLGRPPGDPGLRVRDAMCARLALPVEVAEACGVAAAGLAGELLASLA